MMNNSMNNGAANNNNNSNNGGFIMTTGTIRTMELFADTVKTAMEVHFGEDYRVQLQDVIKNNDSHLTGLTILNKNCNITPTIYLESYYEMYKAGESMATICQQIIKVYEENKVTTDFDVSSVTEFERVNDRICYKLINAERNQELLANAPHVKFHDLAIIYYILVSREREGFGAITVKNHIMKFWDVSEEELLKYAVHNTQRLFRGKVESMANMVLDMLEDRMDMECANEFYDMMADVDDMIPMYICTNEDKINGAGTFLYNDLLKELSDKFDSDVYILPSSIHETLLIPADGEKDIEELKDMVRTINATEVSPEEVLSDNVYVYIRATDRVEMA